MVFHVLNRGVARVQVFEKTGDYQAFKRVLEETLDESPVRICAYCLLPNHWHLLLWPEHDGDLATFMQRMTIMRPIARGALLAVRRPLSRLRPSARVRRLP
jgi:putative transposase